jgi:hypothetical protein
MKIITFKILMVSTPMLRRFSSGLWTKTVPQSQKTKMPLMKVKTKNI